jgi:hypothetical protein
MSIKNRLAKIEQKLSAHSVHGEWARVIVKKGETKQEACDRWRADNLDKPLPDNIVYRVIVEPNR